MFGLISKALCLFCYHQNKIKNQDESDLCMCVYALVSSILHHSNDLIAMTCEGGRGD